MEPLLEKFLLAIGWRSPHSGPTNRFIQRNNVPTSFRNNLNHYWLNPDESQLVVPPDYLDARRTWEVLDILKHHYPQWLLEYERGAGFVVRTPQHRLHCAPVEQPHEAVVRFLIERKKKEYE